jgi:lysozyme
MRNLAVSVAPHEFDALVSFTFNLGEAALARSSLLRKLNTEDRAGAAEEFSRWRFAGGRELRGLVKRRAAERALFLGET